MIQLVFTGDLEADTDGFDTDLIGEGHRPPNAREQAAMDELDARLKYVVSCTPVHTAVTMFPQSVHQTRSACCRREALGPLF